MAANGSEPLSELAEADASPATNGSTVATPAPVESSTESE
jgi:hypothetical protein